MLTSRLIDRPIRPLFPDGWRNETQIIALVISADADNDSDVLAITGASAALALSSIPQSRTLAAVRVGFVDGQFIVNPTFEQRKTQHARPRGRRHQGRHRDGRGGRQGSRRKTRWSRRSSAATPPSRRSSPASTSSPTQAGKAKRAAAPKKEFATDLVAEVEGKVLGPLAAAMRIKDKLENYATVDKVVKDFVTALSRTTTPSGRRTRRRSPRASRKRSCATRSSSAARASTAAGSTRSATSRSKSASCRARTAPALFTRGETQALVVATLGTADDQQKIETVDGET